MLLFKRHAWTHCGAAQILLMVCTCPGGIAHALPTLCKIPHHNKPPCPAPPHPVLHCTELWCIVLHCSRLAACARCTAPCASPPPPTQVWAFVLLAVVGGYVGALFTSFNTWVCLVRKRWSGWFSFRVLEVRRVQHLQQL